MVTPWKIIAFSRVPHGALVAYRTQTVCLVPPIGWGRAAEGGAEGLGLRGKGSSVWYGHHPGSPSCLRGPTPPSNQPRTAAVPLFVVACACRASRDRPPPHRCCDRRRPSPATPGDPRPNDATKRGDGATKQVRASGGGGLHSGCGWAGPRGRPGVGGPAQSPPRGVEVSTALESTQEGA